MKKQVFIVLLNLIMITLLLTGCSADTSANASTKPNTDTSANNSIKPSQSTSKTSASSSEPSETKEKGFGKVLVVYYSLTGNTREVANLIKDKTGADIFEIQTEEDYYTSDIEEIAQKQIDEGYKPKLKNSISNIEKYDMIFVGSPVWWYSVPPPVMSFLSTYDLEDKKVVPFCTCGSVCGDFFKKFENGCSDSKVLKGIDFTKSTLKDMNKVDKDIEAWLKEIKSDLE